MSAFLGQMRVRVLESLYSVELRHHKDPAESSNEDKGHVTGRKVHATSDWLCAWLGSEHLCVNVSCRFEDSGSGQVQSRLSHSFHLLNATGILSLQYMWFYTSSSRPPSHSVVSAGCRRSSRQQCRGGMGPGWQSAVRPCRARGRT